MYKQAYIESALPMITDKIAVDTGGAGKEVDLFPVREFGGGKYEIGDRVIGNVDKVITIDDNNKIVLTGAGTALYYRKEKTPVVDEFGMEGGEKYVFKEVPDMSNFVAGLSAKNQKRFERQFGTPEFTGSKYTVELPEL